MPILEEYWAGVLARVNAEVHTFARLIRHNAQMGTENEAIFSRLLERLLPRRYGVGTGMIIDSSDGYSRQTDIVVYDLSDQPTLFAQSTELIYPIEAVSAAVEIKTRLSVADIADIGRKVKQLRELRPHGLAGDSIAPYDGSLPYCAVLSYGTRVAPETVLEGFSSQSTSEWPDLLCIIDSGLVMCRNGELAGAEPGRLHAGIALRHKRMDDGVRVRGAYASAEGDEASFEVGGEDYAVEPARALILFLQALAGGLQIRKPPESDVMSLYLREPVSDLVQLKIDD